MLLLVSLLACVDLDEDPPPASESTPDTATETDTADDTSDPTVSQTVLACDETVRVPTALGDNDAPAATPHEETFGAAPEPYHVRIGMPSSDPSTSVSFLWRTDTDTLATQVAYGVDGALDQVVDGASFTWGGADQTGHRMHEVKLCERLEPDTEYSYRVGGGDTWSETYTFRTPPAPGSFDTYRVAIAGDSRGAYETWGDLLAQAEAHDPDIFLFSGDMVDLGVNQSEWDAWFDAAGDLWTRKLIVPAHGNHEFLATNYFAQFSLPNNEEWFSLQWGDLLLVSLNDTVRDADFTGVDQVAFMNEVFGESDARWRWAMHHRAIYSTCTTHGSNEGLRAEWEPVFDRHGLQFVTAGHNHIYERSVPIRGGQEVAPADGTTYVVSGGAGAPLYTRHDDLWFGNVVEPIEHYVIVDVSPAGAEAVVYDLSGNVIDAFTLVP